MAKSIYQDIDTTRLSIFLELPHKVNTVRYIGVAQGEFLSEIASFETFNDLQLHIADYVKCRAIKGGEFHVDMLGCISLLKAHYAESDQSDSLVIKALPTGLYAHLNEYSLTALLYRESINNEQIKAWLNELFSAVTGMKEDYNEFMFFLNELPHV